MDGTPSQDRQVQVEYEKFAIFRPIMGISQILQDVLIKKVSDISVIMVMHVLKTCANQISKIPNFFNLKFFFRKYMW